MVKDSHRWFFWWSVPLLPFRVLTILPEVLTGIVVYEALRGAMSREMVEGRKSSYSDSARALMQNYFLRMRSVTAGRIRHIELSGVLR